MTMTNIKWEQRENNVHAFDRQTAPRNAPVGCSGE
jgi:hypothetical protein